MSDLPTWARVLLYGAGAMAVAVLLYVIVYLAVRAALRSTAEEQRHASRRQEDLLRTISTSAEYVADVADAWAEAEAERRASASPRDADEQSAASASAEGDDHTSAG